MTTKTKTPKTSTPKTSPKAALDRVAEVAAKLVSEMPALHAGEYREAVGARIGQLGKALRAAERRGLVAKTWDGAHWRWSPKAA